GWPRRVIDLLLVGLDEAFSARSLEGEKKEEDAKGDRGVGQGERRPAEGQLDEVRHRPLAEAGEHVAEGPPKEQTGRQPDEALAGVTGEVGEQRRQSHRDEDGDSEMTAREETKCDAPVAGVHELDPWKHFLCFALRDRAFDQMLA